MKYKILTNSQEGYELAKRSARTVKALRLLQVRSAYYSDVYRYGIAKEQCIEGFIENEKEEDNRIVFDISPAEIGADKFRDEVAKLLFPSAPVEQNMDDIDYSEVEEGLSAFLNFIEPRYRKQADLSSLLTQFPSGVTGNTNLGTTTEDQSKKKPTTEISGK